ncbi:hypothetical protein BGZ46_000319 [Entomortierella lignicola]|nr:hypothetical protein BGZ46_000319 [Entomortierella lignicola]
MADANARLEFLWKASHLLLNECPGASSHYMSQFLSLANSRDLRLHEDIQTKSCAACGSIFVPGLNSKIRIVPVNETKLEKEKRKKAERKKSKMEKQKQQKSKAIDADQKLATTSGGIEEEPSTLDTPIATPITPTLNQKHSNDYKTSSQKSKTRKIIRITPYTELAQQQQSQQQQRRLFGGNQLDTTSTKKANKRANQLLNYIIYSCQRCNRDTELPGTKEGYLNSRIKSKKPISQRRKLKKEKELAAETEPKLTTEASPVIATPTSSKAALQQPATNSKRPAPVPTAPDLYSLKRPKHAASLPASPAGRLSKASSVASSAASSPTVSPRILEPDNGRFGAVASGNSNSSNRKKKKGGLAGLLANQQKPKDSSNDGASGSNGGDSVLANFLMGL